MRQNIGRAVIILNGTGRCLWRGGPDDFVVCADGGANYANCAGIRPDVIIGDLDSINPVLLDLYRQQGVEIHRYPIDKDKTDGELAVDYLARGEFRGEVVVLSGLGGRFDQTIANLFLLELLLQRGFAPRIQEEDATLYLVAESLVIEVEIGDLVSLIPLDNRVTVRRTSGLQYFLENEILERASGRGISNVAVSEKVEIEVDSGLLLVVRNLV